jgi:hypothetical protein
MLPVQSVRKINFVICGVNENRKKSLCKFVDDCGKKKERDFRKRTLRAQRAQKAGE